MDKVQEQAELIEKKLTPFVASQPTSILGGLTNQNTTGGESTNQNATGGGESTDQNTTGEGESTDQNTTKRGESTNQNTTGGGESTDQNTTKGGESTDQNTTKGGESTDQNTTKRGESTNQNTIGRGESTDQNTTKGGESTDQNTTKGGESTDQNTTKGGESTDQNTTGGGKSTDQNTTKGGESTNQNTTGGGESTDQNTTGGGESTDQNTTGGGESTDQNTTKGGGLTDQKITIGGGLTDQKTTGGGGLTDQKTTGGSKKTQPPTTSPSSPPSPDSGGGGGGSQSSTPAVVTVSPPPRNKITNTTSPPKPPSSPPPSKPPSPPQPQPPPQSGTSPVVIPTPKPQVQMPLTPPTLVTQQPTINGLELPNNPIFNPSPPSTALSPPSTESSGGQGSPPSSPSPPGVSLTPNAPRNPSQPLESPPAAGGSNHVPSSSSSPSPNRHNTNSNGSGGGNGQENSDSSYTQKTMIGIGIAGFLVIIFVAAVFFIRRRKKKSSSPRSNQNYLPPANVAVNTDGFVNFRQKTGNGNISAQHSSPDTNSLGNPKPTPDSAVLGNTKTLFTFEELSQITEGFSKRFVIGEGGFGYVYKGIICEGKPIAIKQLKSISAEGYREFKAEVEIISRVHHRHLVSLVGYCISEQHRFLIYEFVPNNTLDYHLHGKDLPVLEWTKRVKIAVGAAKGLAYLHEDCHPKIIHRDIKSSNILLDNEFEAQVADFGLARLNDTAQSHISTRVMGTFGYLAPEYASSGKLTDRSDVFSFGVVLLELITGRKPVDTSQPLGEESLVEWARPLLIEAIEKGDISEVVDPRLEKHYLEGEVYRMIETAASCVRHSALKRPRMVQVVRALDTRDDMSDLSNGVKVGQSIVYNSGQYSNEIRMFRRASEDSSVYAASNGYYTSQDFTSRESEKAFNTNRRTNY